MKIIDFLKSFAKQLHGNGSSIVLLILTHIRGDPIEDECNNFCQIQIKGISKQKNETISVNKRITILIEVLSSQRERVISNRLIKLNFC